jgi:hypothetical protein
VAASNLSSLRKMRSHSRPSIFRLDRLDHGATSALLLKLFSTAAV